MSNEIETINLEEDLDYELDIEMDAQQEDALLEADENSCGEQDHENELVEKMSMTSFATIEPPATVIPNKPLLMPVYSTSVPITNDFWGKSISTIENVLHASATKPTVVEPQDISNKYDDSNQIQQRVVGVIPPVQPQQNVLDEERKGVPEPEKLETTSVELNGNPEGISPSDGLTATPSSSSTSSSSSKAKSKRNSNKSKSKNKKRRLFRNALLNGSSQSKHPIPSLMSINTQLAFPRNRFPALIPVNSLTGTVRKRAPFIIKAQTTGDSITRTVTVNPGLVSEGFTTTLDNRNRRFNTAVSSLNFNNVAVNKRRSTISLESIGKCDKRTADANPLPMSVDTEEMSDDEKKYLMAIEEQKKKREEILRQKEWKRNIEGWQFLDD